MKCRWIVFSFLAALPLFAEVELTGSPGELSGYLTDIPQTVSITGKAEKKVPADQAIIHIEVTTESRSMDEALTENRKLRQQITTKLLSAGLIKDHIKADTFSSTPESSLLSDKVKSYTVKNSMTITASSEAEFQAVAALIDEYKEIKYKKTEFELSNRKELERQLLAEACRDAVAKKEVYAFELKVTLTPVRFHDGDIVLHKPQTNRRFGTSKMVFEEYFFESGSADTIDTTPPPVQFDEMTLNASVTVEYSLSTQQP